MGNAFSIYKTVLLVVLTVFVFSIHPVFAQVTFTQNRPNFLNENPNLAFEDFLGTFVAPGDLIVCNSHVSSSSDDDCFSPGQILPGIEFSIKPPVPSLAELILVGSDFLGNNNPTNALVANQFQSGLDVSFTPAVVNAVGMTAGCLLEDEPCTPRNMVVSVYGQNGLLGSTMLLVSDSFNSFLGINSNEPITEILLIQENINNDFQEGLLNVWFPKALNPIPALSEWGMITAASGLLLVAVFFAMYRKRAAKV